jgi:ribosomal protein L3 glutamine methyltransferase
VDSLKIEPEVLAEAAQHLETIRDFIRFGVTAMRNYEVHLGQGTEDFFAESSALVLQSLSLEWSADEQILDARLLPSEKQRILAVLERRINDRTPLGYLLNLSYFAGQPYYVDERVLIPRSPMAELIDNQFSPYFSNGLSRAQGGVNQLPHNDHPVEPIRMLDLCTGSGCIAIALAFAFPDAIVDGVDISRDALEVAAINLEHHQKDDQVSFIESNLLDKIPPQRQYDLIISNPPYVDAEDMADLPNEFLHEPELALAAGRDGLDLVRHILAQAADYLTDNGLLVVEVGNSEWALRQAFPKVKFHWLHFTKGGTGVFALTAKECRQHQQEFQQSLNA